MFFTKNAFERYCATGNTNVLSVAACDLQVQRSRFAPRTKNYAAMKVIVNQTSYTAISCLDLQTYNLRVHFSSCAFNLHWWIDHDLSLWAVVALSTKPFEICYRVYTFLRISTWCIFQSRDTGCINSNEMQSLFNIWYLGRSSESGT